jgi:type III restriction enzyme
MKLQFKYQQFQADAANAICDVFKGQRLYSASSYLIDRGIAQDKGVDLAYDETDIGIRNHRIELSEDDILSNLRSIQKVQGIKPDENLEKYAVEMEDPITEKKIHKKLN